MTGADEPDVATGGVRMIVFAGPNGSGKTTTIEATRTGPQAASFPALYINADDIARTEFAAIADPFQRNLAAAQAAESRRRQAIESRQAFAFETVMSTPEKVALITQARARGYDVLVVFVTTADPQINVRRVAQRVIEGGHGVPTDKIVERYENAMRLLPHAVDHAQHAQVYDNSAENEAAVALLVARKQSGRLRLAVDPASAPDWVAERLVAPYVDLQRSRQVIAQAFDVLRAKRPDLAEARVSEGDASEGKRYDGVVIAKTAHHALQQVGPLEFAVHDRALYPARVVVGRSASIAYAWQAGRFVRPSGERARAIGKTRRDRGRDRS